MALHNVSTGDTGANQSIPTITSLPSQRQHFATPNLGSAVSSSMHLTNSSHDSDVLGATSNYKTEHDMMYYSVIKLNYFLSIFFNLITRVLKFIANCLFYLFVVAIFYGFT